jgi:hypothetical protein
LNIFIVYPVPLERSYVLGLAVPFLGFKVKYLPIYNRTATVPYHYFARSIRATDLSED